MDDQAIAGARNYATETANTAAKYNSQGYTVADELRKAIGERYGESDIAKSTAEARGTFLAQAPQDRMAVQGMVDSGAILSPGQQQAVLAAKRGSALVPLMGANLVDSAAFGTIEDLINAGTNAFKAQGSYAMSLAQQAQQTYQNLMDEAIKRAQQKQIEEELAMKKAMAPFEQQLMQAQIANTLRSANQPYGGAGTKDTKYPFEEPYVSLGLAGKVVSTVGDKLVVESQADKESAKQALEKQKAIDAMLGKNDDYYQSGDTIKKRNRFWPDQVIRQY